jgi:hypothetical protein
MSLSSKPKKVRRKAAVRELKLVQSISRRGADSLKAEEVTTPRRRSQNEPSTSQRSRVASSIKRPKLEFSDVEAIPCDLEGPNASQKRQTLVFPFPMLLKKSI